MPKDDLPLPVTLLALAGAYTSHNDALSAVTIDGPAPVEDLLEQIPSTQRLARATLDTIGVLRKLPLAHTLDVRDVETRLTQLVFLTTAAADHLIDAMDIAGEARAEASDNTDSAYVDALKDAGRQIRMARKLTSLAPEASVDAAETLTIAMHRQHLRMSSDTPQPTLSPNQHSALRAIARGHVEIHDTAGKQYVSSHDDRLLLSTLRSLESKELLHYDHPRAGNRRRTHLTATGLRTLAATFGRPAPAAPRAQPARKPAPPQGRPLPAEPPAPRRG